MRPALVLPLLLLTASAAAAQAPAGPPPPRVVNNFARLFPSPTGKNGYEELVQAGDLVGSSADFRLLEEGNAPLSVQRRVLQESPIQKALGLMRRGLAKQTFSPRTELHIDTLLPELQEFRRLGRLLKVQMHVQFADGRTSEAIETARLGLRLGKATDTDTLISSLVGAAINAIITSELGAHLDQLSARDCEALYRLSLDWLRQPDPVIHAIMVERQNAGTMIADLKQRKPEQLAQDLGIKLDNAAQVAALKEIYAKPGAIAQVFDRAGQQLDEYYARVLKETVKPPWQRSFPDDPPPTDPVSEPASYLMNFLKPSLSAINNAFTRDQARMRLLACHAAVLRYRWEHDRLPTTLDELRLGDLTVDPFTGQNIQYEPGPRYYRLASVGAPAGADDPMAVNGRRPVSIVPGE